MIKINTLNTFSGLARYELWKSGWEKKDQVDEYSYISNMCHPEEVLLCSKLFFPGFVCAGGGVFIESRYNDDLFNCWLERFSGDLQATEKMINHTHLYDVFEGCSEEVDDKVFEQLAEVFAFSWRLLLDKKFPDKNFKVEVSNSDQDYGPVVTFYQVA